MAYKKQYNSLKGHYGGDFEPLDKVIEQEEKPAEVASKPSNDGFVEALNNTVNIRLAPGTDGEIIGQVSRGTRLAYKGRTEIVENTPWYMIEYDGKDAWISGNISKLD